VATLKPAWLAQLAPPHAPPAPSWWPPAPGWWGLAIVVVLALAGIAYRQTRPAARLRRAALRQLVRLEAQQQDDGALAQALEHLLRRYALARYGHDAVAGLSGERWLRFVVGHGGDAWAGTSGTDLLRAAYGGPLAADRQRWLDGARAFIEARR
jgi:hypothetical protein